MSGTNAGYDNQFRLKTSNPNVLVGTGIQNQFTKLLQNNARQNIAQAASSNYQNPNFLHGYANYTVNGTFLVPNGVSVIYVTAVGGGGGGGGGGAVWANTNVAASGGGGGGAGQSVYLQAVAVEPGQSLTITIGAYGVGGGGSCANGGAGSGGTAGGGTTVAFGNTTLVGVAGGLQGLGGVGYSTSSGFIVVLGGVGGGVGTQAQGQTAPSAGWTSSIPLPGGYAANAGGMGGVGGVSGIPGDFGNGGTGGRGYANTANTASCGASGLDGVPGAVFITF